MLTIVGTIGRSAVVKTDTKFSVQRSVAVLKPDLSLVNPDYLNLVLQSPALQRDFLSQGVGVAQKGIYLKQLGKLQISLPPLPEQHRIAETLDRAQRLVDLRKKQIEELDRLAQAVFIELFGNPEINEKGWEITSIEKACSNIIELYLVT